MWRGPAIVSAGHASIEVVVQLTPYVGYLAGGLAVVSLIPQVLSAWRTKQTKGKATREPRWQ